MQRDTDVQTGFSYFSGEFLVLYDVNLISIVYAVLSRSLIQNIGVLERDSNPELPVYYSVDLISWTT